MAQPRPSRRTRDTSFGVLGTHRPWPADSGSVATGACYEPCGSPAVAAVPPAARAEEVPTGVSVAFARASSCFKVGLEAPLSIPPAWKSAASARQAESLRDHAPNGTDWGLPRREAWVRFNDIPPEDGCEKITRPMAHVGIEDLTARVRAGWRCSAPGARTSRRAWRPLSPRELPVLHRRNRAHP